jgi:hypothetical protein
MASYLLYVITGIVLAFMAGRHLFGVPPDHSKLSSNTHRFDIIQTMGAKGLHWAEAALSGAILLFGVWLTFTATLLLVASIMHSF